MEGGGGSCGRLNCWGGWGEAGGWERDGEGRLV